MKEKILKNRKLIDFLIIFLVALLIGIPLLNSKLDVYFDDGNQHIARIYGTLESMKDNWLFPNVIPTFSNGYGYSWNLFYGPLSVYGTLLIYFFVRNYIVAYKIFAFICMLLSGITMYKFVKTISGNRDVGILGSILYMTFPYHLTDIYTRNALGEYVSFVFIPLVFLGLYELLFTKENKYHLAIGASCLILTHNLSTAIVALFSLIFVLVNWKKLIDKEVLKKIGLNVIAIVLVTCFYWFPLLETKFATEYQVYNDGAMATSETAAYHALELKQLFVTMNDGSYVFELGPHILIMFALSIMTFRLMKPEFKKNYIIFFVCSLLTLWMSTKYFPWKYLPNWCSIIQFPWRMVMMSAFFLSFVCAINMYVIIKKFNIKDVMIISSIAIIYILAIADPLIHYAEEPWQEIYNYNMGQFTGKTSESIVGVGKGEYLTQKAYNRRFYVASREPGIYVLTGKAIIENEEKTGNNYSADIKTGDAECTVFELPYIYYPGYEVSLDSIKITAIETENGFLGFALGPKDSGELKVSYEGTPIMKISMALSTTYLFVCILLWAFAPKDKNIENNKETKSEDNKEKQDENTKQDEDIKQEVDEKKSVEKEEVDDNKEKNKIEEKQEDENKEEK